MEASKKIEEDNMINLYSWVSRKRGLDVYV